MENWGYFSVIFLVALYFQIYFSRDTQALSHFVSILCTLLMCESCFWFVIASENSKLVIWQPNCRFNCLTGVLFKK